MIVVALRTLLEEAVANPSVKNASGNIKSMSKLLEADAFVHLEHRYKGLFAFLAFHPGADAPVTNYVKSGTLASDSGPDILVLFTSDTIVGVPRRLTAQAFETWVEMDVDVHPAYQMIRTLFLPGQIPPLPGIVFFESFTTATEPVYITLHDLADEAKVRERLRTVFSLADALFRQANQTKPDQFINNFCVELKRLKIHYVRTGPSTVREWIVQAYQTIDQHKGDIISALGLLV